MERYYVRWYGPPASVSKPMDRDVVYPFNEETLRASVHDLDEAAGLVADKPDYQGRVDDLRAYVYMLYLRYLDRRALQGNRQEQADGLLADELRWIARLSETDMVHARGLLSLAGKGATWRNRKKSGEEKEKARIPADVLKPAKIPPTHEEIEANWNQLKSGLGL